MSTAHDEHTDSGDSSRARSRARFDTDPRRIQRLVRVLAVLAALASLLALWSGERLRLDHDLQLIAEAVARPGETLAVRALLFEHVDDPRGPGLALMPVKLRLLDSQSRSLVETTLRPQRATRSMEGELQVPATLRGAATLVASARLSDGTLLECTRSLQIGEDAPILVARPRGAGPLQTLAIGSTRSLAVDAPAPTPFLPRIVGGACPSERPCTILIWVGEPGSSVTARTNAQVSVPAPASPAGETTGLVALEVIPHGLEAQLTLEARRGGRLVAERAVRLPVALGEVGVFVRTPLLEPTQPLPLSFTLPPGREHAIVDIFVEGRWRASRSIAKAASAEVTFPAELIPAGGLARIQARVDPFTSEGSGSRFVYRRAAGETPEQAFTSVVSLAQRVAPDAETKSWSAAQAPLASGDLQRSAAFALAPLELLRVPLPDAHSARPQQLAKLQRKRAFLHFGVASVVLLAAVLVASSLMRRGLSAASEARAILDEARETGDAGGAEPAEMGARAGSSGARLGVILLVLAVALAFLAGALLIVAKPLWF